MGTSRRFAFLSLLLGAIIAVGIEFHLGPYVHGGALFLAPVALAAWYLGRPAGLICAIYLPIVRLAFYAVWETPWPWEARLMNFGAQLVGYVILVFALSRKRVQYEKVKNENRRFRSLLSICDQCLRVQTPDRGWETLSAYLSRTSLGGETYLCPSCATVLFPKRSVDARKPAESAPELAENA